MDKKNNPFEIKAISENETSGIKQISGIANKFEVIDAYGDVSHEETFINTVRLKPKVPLLWGHNISDVIGIASLSNQADGLWADMEINTNIAVGKEAYEITKQLHNAGRPMQLSIGYRTIKSTYEELEDGLVRHLDEVEVLEISLTPIAANSESEVQDVKNHHNVKKSEFNQLLFTVTKTLNETKSIKGSVSMRKLRELLELKKEKELKLKSLKTTMETKSEITDEEKTEIKELVAEIKKIVTEIEELQALQVETEEAEKSLTKIAELKHTNYEQKLMQQKDENNLINFNNPHSVISSKEYKVAWLKTLQKQPLTESEKKFLQVGTNVTGNQDATPAIPTTVWSQIIAKLKQTSQLINAVTVTTVKGNLKFPVEKISTGGGWHQEGTKITGELDLTYLILNGYEWARLIKVSESALEMTIDDFEPFIVNNLITSLGVGMETAISNGTGSQQPTGILVESDIPTINLAGTITYDTILKLIGSLPTAYLANAKFVINKKTFYQQVLGLKDKNDRPLVRDIVLDGITRFQILGYEAIISDYYPDFESAKDTDKVISFGDLSYYKLNFNKPAQVKRSDDAFFEEGLIGFRVLAIADGRYTLPEAMINVVKGATSPAQNLKKN